MNGKLYVIGIGYRPFDKKTKEIIFNASIILASNRLFEVFKRYEEYEAVKDKVKVINNVDETIEFIRTELPSIRAIVLLASGDPMFFGIGRRVVRKFGRDNVSIIPDLSSIQIAFARIKEAWDDAFLMSLHGGPDPEKRRRLPYEIKDIPSLLKRHNKVAILTDKENNPSAIAKELLKSSALKIFVCERLGYDDEKVIEGTAEEIANKTFREPNVVIIKSGVRSQESEVRFGLTEDEIAHSRGLITKDEVRAVTIHKLRLPQKGILWDIGAGSGSVSIEVSRLYPELKIFTIERDKEQINHIRENKERFNSLNIEVISGEAPDVLINLPSPDRVFIGGSGGRLKEIVDFISDINCEHAVINATTIETLNDAIQYLKGNGFEIKVSEIFISRSKGIAGKNHMSALNPVFIITGEKGDTWEKNIPTAR
ncbi:precorrin-6Y-methylase [Dissulfurispira thermophila]|uniref:tRNA (guanine(46)-N(7))-methyltransferase n=1 Tax=Dissulfurispira thermophila TaxID=2715679 RepID=A0A7G1H3M4_9BACT|nr:precorrin-6y C5,15-methyltransferase (decarboxylating) subunit CbiE [Dissulfurispira thermophila]BCB97404.1 precorrin-6Y-methylase [Dissulfurispira thermophila]